MYQISPYTIYTGGVLINLEEAGSVLLDGCVYQS